MIVMLFAVIIGVLSLNFFSLNFSIQGLNRTIIATPIELMYTTIIADSEAPTFNNRDFEDKVWNYYDRELTKYTDNYQVHFYYYRLGSGAYCSAKSCPAVEITVTSSLTFNYQFKRVMYYELRVNG